MVRVLSTSKSWVSAEPSLPKKPALQKIDVEAARGWLSVALEIGQFGGGVAERITASAIVNLYSVKAQRRISDADIADKTKLGGPIVELRRRHVITEIVARPGELQRLGRDLDLGMEDFLIFVVARQQHHPVLAERDRAVIVICRYVPNIENRHCRSTIASTPAISIARACFSTTITHACIYRARYRLFSLICECRMKALLKKLLGTDEPAPVSVRNAGGNSVFLLVADHAGNLIPRALCGLGIAAATRERHIAWDIGIASLGRLLADALDATFIQQNYSRLVIDVNRPLDAPTSIPDISDRTAIPGNTGLDDANKAARADEIFRPYHNRIEAELDFRLKAGRPAALIALHSFTPVFEDIARPWHAAVLYNHDPRFAHRLMALLNAEKEFTVGDNAPYSVSDATDYTIPVHAERRGLHHVLIEIRQDLIAEENGQRAWALRLARLLPQAYDGV
jgi:predicted N-formylglutamate amidohydrolase